MWLCARVSVTVFRLCCSDMKFVFSHIKPYNQNIYVYIQCPAAILWQRVKSSLLAENNGGTYALRQSVKKYKTHGTHHMFSGVLSCIYMDIWPKSGTFSCFMKPTNRRFPVTYPCLASCFSVGAWEDTTKHSTSFTYKHWLNFSLNIWWCHCNDYMVFTAAAILSIITCWL